MDFGKQITKVIIITLSIAGLGWYYLKEKKQKIDPPKIIKPDVFGIDEKEVERYLMSDREVDENSESIASPSNQNSLPDYVPSFTGMVLHKKAYYLSYLTDKKIAEWVAYPLTKEIIVKGNFERSGYFEVDPELGNKQAGYYDFSSSGYIRGHLVPVADVSYDLEAMKQSYLLSNIAPMNASFNEGVWFDLEKTIRDWAYRYRHIYVVTGPILNNAIKYIGKGKIAAPSAYFKAVWIEDDVHPRAIGFVLENSARSQSIQESIISIDDLEFITKLDLFPEIVEDDDESRIESTLDVTSFIWMKPINNSSQ